MIVFYAVLCALATIGLTGTALQGWLAGSPGGRGLHGLCGILTTVFVCFVHSLLMSWLLGLGKSQKTAVQEYGLDPEFLREMRRIKARGFPMATFAPLALIGAGLLGGAARAGAVDPVWHQAAVAAAIAMNVLAFPGQLRVVRDNERLMCRIEEDVARRIPHEPDGGSSGNST